MTLTETPAPAHEKRDVSLPVEGMTCATCALRVEKALTALPGVEATVNLATERASVRALSGPGLSERLRKAIVEAGYEPRNIETDAGAGDRERARRAEEMQTLQRRLLIAAALAAPVVILEMGGHMIPAFHHWVMATIGEERVRYISFIFTTLALFGPGLVFYLKGVPALLRGQPDMNALVAVGTLSAYLYSVVATFLPHLLPAGAVHAYYEAAVVIVVLILLGRYLEARAKGQTSEAIRALARLQPKTAHVERDGVTQDIDIDDVRAVANLPARDFAGLLPLFFRDHLLEQARADYVGALAHVDEQRAFSDEHRLQSGQSHGRHGGPRRSAMARPIGRCIGDVAGVGAAMAAVALGCAGRAMAIWPRVAGGLARLVAAFAGALEPSCGGGLRAPGQGLGLASGV